MITSFNVHRFPTAPEPFREFQYNMGCVLCHRQNTQGCDMSFWLMLCKVFLDNGLAIDLYRCVLITCYVGTRASEASEPGVLVWHVLARLACWCVLVVYITYPHLNVDNLGKWFT